jgi:hypothetical protein
MRKLNTYTANQYKSVAERYANKEVTAHAWDAHYGRPRREYPTIRSTMKMGQDLRRQQYAEILSARRSPTYRISDLNFGE